MQITGDQYPILALTDKSKQALSKKEKIYLPIPEIKEPRRKRKQKLFANSVNQELFEILRILRKSIADKQNIPPYVIFPDTSLHAMATYTPQNKTEFRNISGVGEHKLKTYGEMFIKEIKQYCTEHQNVKVYSNTRYR